MHQNDRDDGRAARGGNGIIVSALVLLTLLAAAVGLAVLAAPSMKDFSMLMLSWTQQGYGRLYEYGFR